MYLTNFSSSKAVKTLTNTRYFDVLLLLLSLEKLIFPLSMFYLCGWVFSSFNMTEAVSTVKVR